MAMVTEVATFHVLAGKEDSFYSTYLAVRSHLSQYPGCRSAMLSRVVELPSTFVLRVEWDRIEDHLDGFRVSDAYVEWRKRLSPFFDGDPSVIHLVEP